jgi:hypothetical protein
MADEIRDQNTIRVFRDGNRWLAVIGPYPEGPAVCVVHRTAFLALFQLVMKLVHGSYTFDPSWAPSRGLPAVGPGPGLGEFDRAVRPGGVVPLDHGEIDAEALDHLFASDAQRAGEFPLAPTVGEVAPGQPATVGVAGGLDGQGGHGFPSFSVAVGASGPATVPSVTTGDFGYGPGRLAVPSRYLTFA